MRKHMEIIISDLLNVSVLNLGNITAYVMTVYDNNNNNIRSI